MAERESLLAKAVTREDRIGAVKEALGDRPRLAVLVSMPERHFGGVTFDPAVETEFGKVLTECGFTLLGKNAGQEPRWEFLGEAFSEYGMRRGNLVSCKARVEVKVRDARSGEILVADRETSVAVDLSEQIAAKKALQQAALELATRVLPAAAKKSPRSP